MLFPETHRLGHVLYEERLEEAAHARRRRAHQVDSHSLVERLRIALGDRLIVWGERMRPATSAETMRQ